MVKFRNWAVLGLPGHEISVPSYFSKTCSYSSNGNSSNLSNIEGLWHSSTSNQVQGIKGQQKIELTTVAKFEEKNPDRGLKLCETEAIHNLFLGHSHELGNIQLQIMNGSNTN